MTSQCGNVPEVNKWIQFEGSQAWFVASIYLGLYSGATSVPSCHSASAFHSPSCAKTTSQTPKGRGCFIPQPSVPLTTGMRSGFRKTKGRHGCTCALECLKSEPCRCLFEEYSLVFLILCVGFLSKPCFLLSQNYFGSVTENTLVTQKAGGNQFPTSYRLSKISWVLGFFQKSRGLEGGSREKKRKRKREK